MVMFPNKIKKKYNLKVKKHNEAFRKTRVGGAHLCANCGIGVFRLTDHVVGRGADHTLIYSCENNIEDVYGGGE